MPPVRVYAGFCCALAVALLIPPSVAQSANAPVLAVDAAANLHPIDPNIYGIACYGLNPQFAQKIRVPNVRWGGDTATRYNWLVDSTNMGFDWFFIGGSTPFAQAIAQSDPGNPVPSASVDQMIATYGAAGARTLVTIPVIPYINRSATLTCSFPVSIYGAQEKEDPYDHPNGDTCGNGISIFGMRLKDGDIYANNTDNSVSLQQGWIEHLINTFGDAANGGVPYYQLDNEPSGWSNTHRDVMPDGANYPQIAALGEQYAAMIKQTDPSSSVFGPSDFSGLGWIGNPQLQNNLYAGQYYLQQMASYQRQHHVRILDYFDEHYYATSFDDASELASTRTLWDPTYLGPGGSVFKAPIDLIPRFKSWIQQYYPGTKLSISEYGFSSWRNPLVDALTEADALGIFGREGLDFANMWTIPMPPPPVLSVFQLFRNYDGQGGQFGDISVKSVSSDQGRLSIYGALRSSDHALTVLVINKTTQPIATTLSLANFSGSTASVFSFSDANLTQVVPQGGTSVVANQIDYDFPAYSATLFVISDDAPLPAVGIQLSSSARRPKFGQSITFTATVSAQGNGAMPSGTVAFINNDTVLGTVALTGGEASLRTSLLSAGTHKITALYSGDANYAASTSNVLDLNIAPLADYSLKLSSSSLDVKSGSSASLTLTVIPQSGFAQAVGFACTGLPAGVICNFNPPDVMPRGGSVSTTTMTVSVPSSFRAGQVISHPSPGFPEWIFFVLGIVQIVCLIRAKMRSEQSVPARAFAVPLMMILAALSLFGCAFEGSSSFNKQSSAQSRTSYVIGVNAGGLNVPDHSQQITLDVSN